MNRIVSPEQHGQKNGEARVHQPKSHPAGKETFSPKTLATRNTAIKVCLPQHTFLPATKEVALYLCVAEKVTLTTAVTDVHHNSI